MTDDLKERLRGLDTIGGIGPMAAARITDLEARLAAAEERAHYAEGVADLAMKHRDAAEAENTRLKRQVETLKTGWGIADRDRIKAEAGEDALVKVTDAYKELLATVGGECPSLVNEDSGASQVLLNLMLAAEIALAAYEARRKG